MDFLSLAEYNKLQAQIAGLEILVETQKDTIDKQEEKITQLRKTLSDNNKEYDRLNNLYWKRVDEIKQLKEGK